MAETREIRLKRLRIRSVRRGIREMDLLLQAYSEQVLDSLDEAQLDLYDALLNENDQDLYAWVTGQSEPPRQFADMISSIALTMSRN